MRKLLFYQYRSFMIFQEKFCALTLESTKLTFEKGFVLVNAVLQCEHDVKPGEELFIWCRTRLCGPCFKTVCKTFTFCAYPSFVQVYELNWWLPNIKSLIREILHFRRTIKVKFYVQPTYCSLYPHQSLIYHLRLPHEARQADSLSNFRTPMVVKSSTQLHV